MPRDDATLIDMAQAIRRALEFVAGYTQEMFLTDLKTQAAVAHQLMVLGEATKRLSEDFRHTQPAIPWRQMAGMRDRLIHGYDVVDLEQVWLAVEKELPGLLRQIEPLLPPHPQEPN